MKRRTFLRHACHSLALPGLMSSFGFSFPKAVSSFLRYASETDRVLVLIYLQGGNDGLNTLIPLDQLSALNLARQNILLPENKLLSLKGSSLGLHPSLAGFSSLYQEGRLGIVQSVGYPDQNFSHFRSTDIWMSGSSSQEIINSGWTSRYLSQGNPDFPTGYPNETATDPLAIEIGQGGSLLFQGQTANMGMVLNNPEAFYQLVENKEENFPDTLAGEKLKHIRLTARQSQQYGKVVQKAAARITYQPRYPDDNELAQQLKIVSRLIAGGLNTSLYLVRLGSFDTHDAQVDANDHTIGEHASLLKQLNDAVMAFMKDLEYQKADERVIGMTFSEFGRRIVSNASQGTDHGAASPLFIFGNQIEGGVYGNNPYISHKLTNQDNLEMQYDFRQVYASLLEQWFHMPATDSNNVMLSEFETLPIIKEGILTELNGKQKSSPFNLYPNPLNGQVTIEFQSSGEIVNVELVDSQGRKVMQIYSGSLPPGNQSIVWNTYSLPAGNYFIIIQDRRQKKVMSAIKLHQDR